MYKMWKARGTETETETEDLAKFRWTAWFKFTCCNPTGGSPLYKFAIQDMILPSALRFGRSQMLRPPIECSSSTNAGHVRLEGGGLEAEGGSVIEDTGDLMAVSPPNLICSSVRFMKILTSVRLSKVLTLFRPGFYRHSNDCALTDL